MNKQELMAAGLTEAQADAVLALHAKALDGNYVTKAVFNAELDKVKIANEEIKARDAQIATLGAFKGTAEELQAKVDKLTQDNIVAKAEADKKIEQIIQDNELKASLVGKVIDADDVIGKLDKSKLVFKENKLVAGLEEQLTELKQSKPHWFPQEKADDKGPQGWNILGSKPVEGDDQKGKGQADDPAEFGKQLAQMQLSGTTAAQKASELYFNK